MQRLMAVVGVLIALGAATAMHGQSQQRRRIVGGPEFGEGGFQMDARGRTTATATLRFTGNDGGPWYSVDFVTSFSGLGDRATSPPTVVDMIVTEHPVNENTPQMTLRVNGDPLATRLYSRRSIAATIPLDELLRMTNASTIVEQAFDTELEFSAGQLGNLRTRVQSWAGH